MISAVLYRAISAQMFLTILTTKVEPPGKVKERQGKKGKKGSALQKVGTDMLSAPRLMASGKLHVME